MDETRSAYWSLAVRQRRELASWKLAAGLVTRLSVCSVLELHEGGGMYDTLHLGLSPDGSKAVKINRIRDGRVHLIGSRSASAPEPVDYLSAISAGPPLGPTALSSAVRAIAEAYGNPQPQSAQYAQSISFLADLLEKAIRRDARQQWSWQSGTGDSAASGLGWRDELFAAVPGMANTRRKAPDVTEQPYWFLTGDGKPILAVDIRGNGLFIGSARHDGLTATSMAKAMAAVRRAAPKGGATLPGIVDGMQYDTLQGARAAYLPVARGLAEDLTREPVQPFMPGAPITTYAHWFTAKTDRLVLVMGPHEDPASAISLLAYGLAWQSRGHLDLVLPPGFADAILRVLSWIRTSVQVYLSTDAGLERLDPPMHHEVLEATAALPIRPIASYDLGPRKAWLDPLLAELASHALTEQHRPSYCAWKFRGRQVLKAVRTTGGNLRITAGTDYSKPTTSQPAAIKIEALAGPLSADQVAQARKAIDRSIADRLAGADASDLEHQLQADLDHDNLAGLGTVHHHREYPAWRSAGRDGFIDFLAATPDGALDVVETKVGGDAAVALQALEYFIWATANADMVRARPGWPTLLVGNAHQVTLVLAADKRGRCHDRYLYGVLEAFHLDVPWRVFTTTITAATAGKAEAPALLPLSPAQLLAGERGQRPCASERWSDDTIYNDTDLRALLGASSESHLADALFRELDGGFHLENGAGVTLLHGDGGRNGGLSVHAIGAEEARKRHGGS